MFLVQTDLNNGIFQVLFLALKFRIPMRHTVCRLWHLISRRTIFQRFALNCYSVFTIFAGQIKRILFYDNFIAFSVLFIQLGGSYTSNKKNYHAVIVRWLCCISIANCTTIIKTNFWSIKKYKLTAPTIETV